MSSRRYLLMLAPAVILLAGALAGCTSATDSTADARAQVDTYHDQYERLIGQGFNLTNDATRPKHIGTAQAFELDLNCADGHSRWFAVDTNPPGYDLLVSTTGFIAPGTQTYVTTKFAGQPTVDEVGRFDLCTAAPAATATAAPTADVKAATDAELEQRLIAAGFQPSPGSIFHPTETDDTVVNVDLGCADGDRVFTVDQTVAPIQLTIDVSAGTTPRTVMTLHFSRRPTSGEIKNFDLCART